MNLFLGIGGAVILLIGSFCPVISLPIVGGLSYLSALTKQLQNGTINDVGISAILVLVSCLGSFAILFARQFALLWITAASAILAVGITIYGFVSLRSQIEKDMPDAGDNPFAGLARMAAEAIQPDFGLAIVAVGAGLLVAAAVASKKAESGMGGRRAKRR
jgi:hypothetical protein